MSRTTSIRTHFSRIVPRATLGFVGVVLLTVLVVAGSGLAIVPSAGEHTSVHLSAPRSSSFSMSAPANQTTSASHTLIIRSGDVTGKYIVTVTGNVTVSKVESSDIVQLPVVQGSVQGNDDTVDVIRFTGHITSFKHRGDLRVTLDGRSVNPTVLDANYIQLESQKNSPTRYRLIGNGTILPGGDTERGDYTPANRSLVDGHVSGEDRTDSFYYTGRLISAGATDNLTVVVNGQQRGVYKKGSRSTATAFPSPPLTDTTTTQAGTSPNDDGPLDAADQPSSGTPETDSEETSETGGLSLFEIVGGVALMGLVAIGGLVLLSR